MPASARRASTRRSWLQNIRALVDAIQKAKPTGAKGTYVQEGGASARRWGRASGSMSSSLAASVTQIFGPAG